MAIIKLCMGGTVDDPVIETFRFRTSAEARAFMRGVNSCIGFFSVRIARHNLGETVEADGIGYPANYDCNATYCDYSETCPKKLQT